MSVIMITKHNECIYDINNTVNQNQNQPEDFGTTETMVKKKHIEEHKRQQSSRKLFGAMGLKKQPLPDPKSFLRKGTGKPPMISRERPKEELDLPPRKEAVPITDCVIRDQMNKLNHRKVNFINENVKKVLKMKPKIPERRQVTDIYGDCKIVPKEPTQVSNKLFAKIPRYLEIVIKQRQAQIEREREYSGIQESKCTYITKDERKQLLDGLKKNWDELQRTYQGLPILTDTIPKKQRKAQIEHELQQLEKDIVLIERHPFIYVYNDEEDSLDLGRH